MTFAAWRKDAGRILSDLAKMVERTKDPLPMIPSKMPDKPKPYGHHPFCYTTPTKVG
jgi:hypothetical protein